MSRPLTKKTFFQVNIQDIRGKKKACEICKKDFSMLVKEHQCKRCKRAVCHNCSQNKAPVYRVNKMSDVPHRQCLKCKVESQKLKDFITENKIVFGKDTLSARWLQSMNNKLKYSEITKEYFDYLNDPQFDLKFNKDGTPEQLTYRKYKDADTMMEKLFQEYCDAFNYSLQEFFHHVINKTDPQTICIQVRNIMKAFLNKHPEFGFENELILIILFFLCFASEPVAFTLMSYFFDLIYPRQLYYKYIKQSGYDIKRYVQLVLQLLETVFQLPASTQQKTQSYLNNDFIRMAFTLSINALSFENTFLIIDNCITNCNFMEYLKVVTAICSIRIEDIIRYADVSFEKLQVVILRNLDREQLQEALDMFSIVDPRAQEKVIQFFNKEEQKDSIVLDEKYFQNKIMQSDQYKELLYRFEKQIEEKEALQKEMKLQDKNYKDLLIENEGLLAQVDAVKQQLIASQQQVFELQNFQQPQGPSMEPGEQQKLMKFQQAQLVEMVAKDTLLREELKAMEVLYNEQSQVVKKLTADVRETNKMLSDLSFDHQNLQFEVEQQNGRGRTSTRSRNIEVKLTPELMQEKLNKCETELAMLLTQFDTIELKEQEQKMAVIRNKRLLAEQQHIQNTLQLEIDLLKESLANERNAHANNTKKYTEQLAAQYKKMFLSLEVAYARNEALVSENEQILAFDQSMKEKMAENTRLTNVLIEENEKLKVENEELNKIAQMAKKSDQEDQLKEFIGLLNDEDPTKQKQIKQLYDKAVELIREIQFRTIDQLLKREYITQLQKRNKKLTVDLEDSEQALKMLASKVEKYIEKNDHSQQSLKAVKQLQQSIQHDKAFVQVKQKEDCIIM